MNYRQKSNFYLFCRINDCPFHTNIVLKADLIMCKTGSLGDKGFLKYCVIEIAFHDA